MRSFERGYGLVVGVGTYSDPAWDVPIAERDAADLHAALTDPDAAGYPAAQVELLCGSTASAAAVLQALERLAARADEQSTVMIAITSHGALAENDLYTLATSDAQFAGGARIRSGTGLSVVQLARALKNIRAERLLLVINACFAGYLSNLATKGGLREAPAGSVLPNKEGDSLLASGKGRALITASRADQRSYFQSGDDHSIFGQAMIGGLRGVGISPRSGYVGLFELYSQAYAQVRRLAALRGNPQEPVLSLVDGVGPFPVALHSGAERRDDGQIQHEPPAGLRPVQITIGTQVIDNSKAIDFSSAQIGNVTIGDVARRDVIKDSHGASPANGSRKPDPLSELEKICGLVETARNVDEDARDDAANKIKQAHRALDQGDRAKAQQRIDEALEILDAMSNGYMISLARKLRAVHDTL